VDTLSYRTVSGNKETANKKWLVVDAEGQTVGRLASKVAKSFVVNTKRISPLMLTAATTLSLSTQRKFLSQALSLSTKSMYVTLDILVDSALLQLKIC